MTILFIVGLFRTVFFLVVVFLLIRLISKLLEPAPQSRQQNKRGQHSYQDETTIRFNKSGKKIIEKDKGEYVDFEEVD